MFLFTWIGVISNSSQNSKSKNKFFKPSRICFAIISQLCNWFITQNKWNISVCAWDLLQFSCSGLKWFKSCYILKPNLFKTLSFSASCNKIVSYENISILNFFITTIHANERSYNCYVIVQDLYKFSLVWVEVVSKCYPLSCKSKPKSKSLRSTSAIVHKRGWKNCTHFV